MNASLVTERLVLRPLTEEDADGPYPGWFNDPEVCAGNSHGDQHYTRDDALAYIRETAVDPSRLIRAIVTNDDGRHVGNISLQRIDPTGRSAELAVIIGDKSCWGKGVGEEACRAMIWHAFHTMNLRHVHCGTFSNNKPMIALAARLGFKPMGVQEKAVVKNGVALNLHFFGLERDAGAWA